MPRIAKVLAIGLVAGAMASGSAAWADGSVRVAMHQKVAFRERAAHMRCHDMRQSVAMHGLTVMQHRTATDRRGRAERRVVHARRRARQQCSMLRHRAAQHPRFRHAPVLATRPMTTPSGATRPLVLRARVRIRVAKPTTN